MKHLIPILILNILLSSSSKGYREVDGKWVYVSYDEAVGKRIKYLETDQETFKVFRTSEFAADKNNVYLSGEIIENADPKSFHVLENSYSSDKNFVFLYNETVINADPKSFQILNYPYSKDNKNIYCWTLPLLTTNIENFAVEKSGSYTHIELTSHFIKTNPDYSWIDTIKYKGVIYADGIGKTNKEKFYGFKKEN